MFLQLLRAIQKGEFHFLISNINRSGNLPYRLPIHFFSNIWSNKGNFGQIELQRSYLVILVQKGQSGSNWIKLGHLGQSGADWVKHV